MLWAIKRLGHVKIRWLRTSILLGASIRQTPHALRAPWAPCWPSRRILGTSVWHTPHAFRAPWTFKGDPVALQTDEGSLSSAHPSRTSCSMGVQLGPETAPWSSVSAHAPGNSCPVDLQGRSAGPHDGERELRCAGRNRSRRGEHYLRAFRIKPEGYTVAVGAHETRAPREPARQAARSTTSKSLPQTRLAATARRSKSALARAALAAAGHPKAATAVVAATRPHEASAVAPLAAPRSRPPASSTPPARSPAAARGI